MRRESWDGDKEERGEQDESRRAKGGSNDEFEIQKRQLPRCGLLSRPDLDSLLRYRSCSPPLYKSVNCLETNLEEYNRYIPIPDSPKGSPVSEYSFLPRTGLTRPQLSEHAVEAQTILSVHIALLDI